MSVRWFSVLCIVVAAAAAQPAFGLAVEWWIGTYDLAGQPNVKIEAESGSFQAPGGNVTYSTYPVKSFGGEVAYWPAPNPNRIWLRNDSGNQTPPGGGPGVEWAEFTFPSAVYTAAVVQFTGSDDNDGYCDIYINGSSTPAISVNTNKTGNNYAIISQVTEGITKVRVAQRGGDGGSDHVAIDWVATIGTACLYFPVVSPSTVAGTLSRDYTYIVFYKHPQDRAPEYVEVVIDDNENDKLQLSQKYPCGITYSQGCQYEASLTGRDFSVGLHKASFRAKPQGEPSILTAVGWGPQVNGQAPRVTSVSVDPGTAALNQNVTFSAQASDTDGTITTYSWRLVKEGTGDTISFQGNNVTRKFTQTSECGVYKAYLTVTDEDGINSPEYKARDRLYVVSGNPPAFVNASPDGYEGSDFGVYIGGDTDGDHESELPEQVQVLFAAMPNAGDDPNTVSGMTFLFKTTSNDEIRNMSGQKQEDGSYEVIFDVCRLPANDARLEVWTNYNGGGRSKSVTRTIYTTAPPGWWDSPNAVGKQMDFGGFSLGEYSYKFSCQALSTINVSEDLLCTDYFSGLCQIVIWFYPEDQFNIGQLDQYGLTKKNAQWRTSARADINAMLLGNSFDLWSAPATPVYDGCGQYCSRPVPTRSYDWQVCRYAFSIPEYKLGGWTVDDGELELPLVPPFLCVTAEASFGLDANVLLTGYFDCHWNPSSFLLSPSVTPSATATIALGGCLGVVQLAALDVTANVKLWLPLEFWNGGFSFHGPCLNFWFDWVAYSAINNPFGDDWRWEWKSGSYPDPPYEYPGGCTPAGGARARVGEPEKKRKAGPLAWPSIAADRNGNTWLAVWVHDNNVDDPNAEMLPDLYYSYFDGASWSQPQPVFAPNQDMESLPRVCYVGKDQAMLVYVHNELPNGHSQSAADYLANQEIKYAIWTYDPQTGMDNWSASNYVENDPLNQERPDGMPEISSDGGGMGGATPRAIVVWTRDEDGITNTDTDRQIASKYWTQAGGWNALTAVGQTADGVLDFNADVHMASQNTIDAAWIRDNDNNLNTTTDRSVYWSSYDVNTNMWSPMQSDPAMPTGGAYCAVTHEIGGAKLIACAERPENGGEGFRDKLYGACFAIPGPPKVFPVGNTVCRWPKIAMDPSTWQPTCVFRAFTRDGKSGLDGEIGVNAKPESDPNCMNWGSGSTLTEDDITDWQIDFDIDSNGLGFIVGVHEDGGDQQAGFGQGFDQTKVIPIATKPDFAIVPHDITATNWNPGQGEPVIFTANAHNNGISPAFACGWKAIEDETNTIATGTLDLMSGSTNTLHFTYVPQDTNYHIISVMLDPDNQVQEMSEGNNQADFTIRKPPPPTGLLATPSTVQKGIDLQWIPVTPEPIARYRIYRAPNEGGGYSEVGTSDVASYTDTTVDVDTDYYYKVTAEGGYGGMESDYSNAAKSNVGPDFDSDGIPDVADLDDDNDGMPDSWELMYPNACDPHNAADRDQDYDQDGLTNYQEYERGTNPEYASSPDTTPPSTPTVTDGGDYTTSQTTLAASWTSSDPESGVALCRYAIGSAPGLTNVVGWTDVGTQTQVTRSDLSLAQGTSYYFSVQSTNSEGLASSVGLSDGITVDTTGPSAPTVQDDGIFVTSTDTLNAAWSASDAESGVASYEYSVGTSAGATDVKGWTSAGPSSYVSIGGLSLAIGQTCYISARATNGAGICGSVGSSNGVLVVEPAFTIAEVLELPNGAWVGLADRSVVGAFTGEVFIEDDDRTAALRVEGPVSSLVTGDRSSFAGQLATPYCERKVDAVGLEKTASAQSCPGPLAMINRSLGGSDRNQYTRGMTNGIGLNNVCLLVTACGGVTHVGDTYFYMDDGSRLFDATAVGRFGVRVRTRTLTKPSVGQYVIVTGIMRALVINPGPNQRFAPVIWPRTQSDIKIVP